MLIFWSAKQNVPVLLHKMVAKKWWFNAKNSVSTVFLRFFYGLSTLALFLDPCGNWNGKKQHTITCSCHLRKLQRTILQFARMKALPTQSFQQVRCANTKGTRGPYQNFAGR